MTTQQVITSLPAECFGVLPATKEIIRIKAGEMGYYPVVQPSPDMIDGNPDAFVDKLNTEDGVTKAQRQAMQVGSMFGWHVPAANPENYNADGSFRKDRVAKVERDDSLWVVTDDTYDRPRFLDGFRDTGEPVWLSDLQRIDPFINKDVAKENAERANGRLRRVWITGEGVTR